MARFIQIIIKYVISRNKTKMIIVKICFKMIHKNIIKLEKGFKFLEIKVNCKMHKGVGVPKKFKYNNLKSFKGELTK